MGQEHAGQPADEGGCCGAAVTLLGPAAAGWRPQCAGAGRTGGPGARGAWCATCNNSRKVLLFKVYNEATCVFKPWNQDIHTAMFWLDKRRLPFFFLQKCNKLNFLFNLTV